MAERENTQLVQRVYELVGARDLDALLQLFAADVEWQVPAMDGVPFAGTWRGHEGLRRFFSTVADAQDVVRFQPERFVAQDDVVIVLGRFAMRVKATGNDAVSEWAHVWTIEGGKVARFREYVDTANVIRAHTR